MSSTRVDLDARARAAAPFYGYRIINSSNAVSVAILENGCKSLNVDDFWCVMSSLVFPPVPMIPMIVLTIMNPCLNYTSGLFISVISLIAVSFVLAWSHVIMFNRNMTLCNERLIHIHNVHTVMLFLMMGSTLGYYNLYAINGGFLYIIGAMVNAMATLMEYFLCVYQREHVYYCLSGECKEKRIPVLCKGCSYVIASNVLGVFFVLSWMGFIVAPLALQKQLQEFTGDQRPESECLYF